MPEVVPAQVRVVVVDDHQLVRASVLRVLRDQPDLSAVGSAGSLSEAIEVVESTRPDVVLLDQMLPDGTGTGAIPELLERHPAAAVVMLTGRPSDAVLRSAVAGGAAGMVSKTAGFEAVLGAVRAAARGDLALEKDLLERLLGRPLAGVGPAQRVPDRDRELLALLASGLLISDVAERLHVEPSHLQRRLASLRHDLGARSTLEAVVRASGWGWFDPPPAR